MHFWIDKSRTQCTYVGRQRIPSSLSAGVGRSRGRVGYTTYKGMAAPVHRFASIEPPQRRLRSRSRGPPNPPRNRALHIDMEPAPPPTTIASIAAAQSVTPDELIRTAALGPRSSPVMPYHLKFGLLVSLALASFMLICLKYYFDLHINSTDRRRWAGAAVAGAGGVAGCVCALSLALRPKPQPMDQPHYVTSTAQHHSNRQPQQQTEQSETGSLSIVSSTIRSESPPTYEMALLLPQPGPPDYEQIR